MNEKNKKELLIRIKVNKKNIKRKENNLKDINNRSNIYLKTQGNNSIAKRNSFSNKFSELHQTDLEPKLIFRNYSQKTYNYQILNSKNINEKGNIIFEMQKNKYLKPLLYSKDIYEKILKCKIADSSFNAYHLKNEERNKNISEDSSKKLEEETLFKNKEKNRIKKNNRFLLNNLKEFNSNYPIKFTKNNLNGNIKYRNNANEALNDNFSFNKLKSYDKIYQTCKNFYYQNITYESFNNSNNSFKFYSTKNRYDLYSKKINNERIGFFCRILEIFFLNIIKKNFKKLMNNLSYMSKINSNSNRSYYTSGKKIYNTNSAKNYKNNIFMSDSTINRTSTFSNHFNVFDNHSKVYNESTFINKNNSEISKEVDNFQKRINRIRINKVMKSNSFNTKYKSDSIDNSKTFNKRKNALLRKINCERNLPYYNNNLLVYKKKNSFSKNSRRYEIKKINKNNLPININLKNTIESEFDSDVIIHKQNLFIFIKCYMIKDINYKIKYHYKYKNKKKIFYDIPLICDKNSNFAIVKQNKNKNVYKKIKIYKLNKNISSGNKRKYFININSYDKTEEGFFEHKNSIKINLHKKKSFTVQNENKRNNNSNNDNINKILINCVKLLTKIIAKLYLKKKFNLFKNNIKKI